MATPSAKPGATPTHLSSPHPSSAPLSRSLAHKSPSMRTPTASGPVPVHHTSGSSHQYATPLAVPSGVDDTVNFSSPSALLALGGYTGISPSPAVHDGLVGAGMNENDMQNLGMQGIKLGVARDNDQEQRHRVEEVVQLLRARVSGRGVSRESVERLSRLEDFESIWQDDNLNIAGNFVDLEIDFYAGQDVVKDVSLRYATPEYTEGVRREEATAVLKRTLAQSPEDAERGKWRSLQEFHENLRWLAKLDKLSQEVNCFEALENLEENFRRIWVEEGKNGKHGGEYQHLCAGVLGRPTMHKGSRIGLGLEYWVEQAKVLDAKRSLSSLDSMEIDPQYDQNSKDELDDQGRSWTVMIECEEGYPSLRISKEWVGNEAFTAGESTELLPSNGASGSVNWLDPPQTMRLTHGNHDPMALDSSMLESSPPNRRFVGRLEPALDVPILAASEIYRQLGMQLPQEFKMITYDALLVSESSPLGSPVSSPQIGRRKRRMSVHAVDSKGEQYTKQHNYTFQSFESITGCTIRDLPFSHPRQLADMIPIFRQYAVLANLIRKTFHVPSKDQANVTESSNATPKNTRAPPVPPPDLFAGHDGPIILSNDDPNEERLNMLLGLNSSDDSKTDSGVESSSLSSGGKSPNQLSVDDVKVDVTLRIQLGQAPALMLLITDQRNYNDKPETARSMQTPRQIAICFEVGLNGHISVVDTAGLVDGDTSGDTEMQGMDNLDPGLQDVQKKIARVLEVSQDLSILVEWVLRWMQQRAGNG
ncbi:Mediator complex, subunit Med1 [Penicillium griseofulvum]|uniref:Mediator of RNA polymerase II transcription subunit 1 n=1 Tax=Penicillium patulum TaxID=5078 RepID=A0A135LVW7_PENPA|nr:Mediator complex, subunit Med1 [Penicillium griseofulvum]KXG53110.1 Mediator complex, subunit Med1 [Penicillium griseofulvum]